MLLLDGIDEAEDALFLENCASYVERSLIPNIRFDFETYPDANALEDFRFTCSDLVRLATAINLPNVFITAVGDRLLGVEALAMLCYRLSYPGKLSRIWKQFGRSDSACSRIITDTYCFLDNEWSDTLFFHDRLALDAIPLGKRENLQKVCYSGHKRRHCLNYQGVNTPDGLYISFFDPIEGRLHDSTMLRESMLLPYLAGNVLIKDLAPFVMLT
ncbi:hypothetical protein PC128_g7260 [Phytophthora cactorum]|nr:hypothetical protein PC128_g7260 [Phytophthora cactorum]